IAHQRRMRQRRGRTRHCRRQFGVQCKAQPVADDRLVHGRRPGRQRHRGRRVEDLAHLQVIEVGAAHNMAVQSHNCPCWHCCRIRVNMAVHMTDEETMLVSTVRAFIDRDVKPTVRDVEHANQYPEAWIEQMKRIGIYGLAIPESYGGSPVSTRRYVLVTQELSRGWMSLAGAMGGHTVVAKLLALFGTEEQKRTYLPPMATGELRATMALTEPGGGSDLQNMKTIALADGSELVINGSKTWISNARRSGLIALLCKTDPVAKPAHTGISVALAGHGAGLTGGGALPNPGDRGRERG